MKTRIPVLTVLLLLTLCGQYALAIPDTERQALINLYNATHGDSWTLKSGWRTAPLHTDGFAMPGTEGGWYGITVDPVTQKVTAIDLHDNNLTGTIPGSLSSLTGLTILRLYTNSLTGPIPPELGSLPSLERLTLFSNQLNGSIPPELGNLPNLQLLSLYLNQLSGPIPPELGDLANLAYLYLNNNQLSGSIPSVLGNLANLKQLYLYSNQLSGPIPPDLGDMLSLQYLELDMNQLSGPIPAELGGLANLLSLNLSSNQLSGPIPPQLGALSNLQGLILSSNQLTGAIPSELSGLTGCSYIDLNSNQLTGSIAPELGALANLQSLYLDSNQLTGSIPPELGTLTSLQYLYLDSNQLTGSIPPELGALTSLRRLYLYSNQISGPIPTALGNLPSLQYVLLYSNQLNGPIPKELASLPNLVSLNLSHNQLSGAIPAELGSHADMWYLNLSYNQLSGPIPQELGGLSSLQYLYLQSNQLDGTIPQELGNCTTLLWLHLHSNKLAGPIPASLAGLSNIESLELGYNALYTGDPVLITYLDTKDPDWASTQTIRPSDIMATGIGANTVQFTWTPIAYTADSGGYLVYVSQVAGGPYTLAGQTADKTASSLAITGLPPATPHYFVVQTRTDSHNFNQSAVLSEYSDEVSATTLAQALIMGNVLKGTSPVAGVVMTGLPDDPVTDASGVYKGLVPLGWTGSVIPVLAGFNFDPVTRPYSTAVNSDLTSEDYSVTYLGDTDDIYEDNDTFETAATLPLGTTQNLVYIDADWFRVYVPAADAGKDLKIRLWGTGFPDQTSYRDTDFCILDSSGRFLSASISGSIDETAYLCDVAEGWYYVGNIISWPYHGVYSLTAEIGDSFDIGYVSGRLTDGSGNGAAGVTVELDNIPFDWNQSRALVTTDANGYYKIGFAPGEYRIIFNDLRLRPDYEMAPDANFLGEIYNGGEVLSITTSTPLTNIDSALIPGGVISGRMTDEAGVPLPSINVYPFTSDALFLPSYGKTDADGRFSMDRLRAGNYALAIFPASASGLATGWHDDESSLSTASPIPVAAGQVTSVVDTPKDTGGSISGRVTDASGQPLARVAVQVKDITGPAIKSVLTDASGNYSVGLLPETDFIVYFNPAALLDVNLVPEYYPDKRLFTEAESVPVISGQITSAIDAVLDPAASITGTVTGAGGLGMPGVSIRAYDTDSDYSVTTTTDTLGNYALRNLTPGAYKVLFALIGRAVSWHGNKATFATADPVDVGVGEIRSDVNATLTEPGGGIAGRVTDGGGAGIKRVTVNVQDESRPLTIATVATDDNGFYTVRGVPTSSVKVSFDAAKAFLGYASEYYMNGDEHSSATPVSVTAGSITPGINAVLTERPTLTIATSVLPSGALGNAYNQSLAPSGGRPFYHWSIVSGGLPSGLVMNSKGLITGMPTTQGTFRFNVRVIDSTFPQQTANRALTITVGPSAGEWFTISGSVLADGLPLSGVVVEGLPGPPVTDAEGLYAAIVPAGWTGAATPTLAGYAFQPADRSYLEPTDSDLSTEDYVATLIDINIPPEPPSLRLPDDGAVGESLMPRLRLWAFSDQDGDGHSNTRWQVDDAADFSSPVWDSGENSGPVIETFVPACLLGCEISYFWRARFKDNRGEWSDWSSSRAFTTIAGGGPGWSALGTGTSAAVNALAMISGSLYAGGTFTQAGGLDVNNVGKWDGINWWPLGSGTNGTVRALAASGDALYAGGEFTMAGGSQANYIAQWDGASWIPLGTGMSAPVHSLCILGGELYAAGEFTIAGGTPADHIAKWDGQSWSALGSGVNDIVETMATDGTDLFVGGWFTTAGGTSASRVAKWNGTAWEALGSGASWTVYCLATSGSDLLMGGDFGTAGGVGVWRVARWDGESWAAIGEGTDDTVYGIAIDRGNIYVTGSYDAIHSTKKVNQIARWDGTEWTALDAGLSGGPGRVLLAAGAFLYAGGEFEMAGPIGASRVASWDLGPHARKVDFNNDGQEDILWRYYGTGGYNRAWYLMNSEGAVQAHASMPALSPVSAVAGSQSEAQAERRSPASRRATGPLADRFKATPPREFRNPMAATNHQTSPGMVNDPRGAGGDFAKTLGVSIADPRRVSLGYDMPMISDIKLASTPSVLGGGDIMPVGDLIWQIVGTGDFDNDTHIDIVWRNSASGVNVVWLMNGTAWMSSVELLPVPDPTWQIVGTGDFNNDTHVDILWRNSVSGVNVVWYMDGVNWSSSVEILGVTDSTWQIVGTGDFNNDGNVDILWRNSPGGWNVVWYMDGANWSSSAELIQVTDSAWQIVGTGDYDNDGSVDILWRFNGPSGANVIWYMDGVSWRESAELLPVGDMNWKIVSR